MSDLWDNSCLYPKLGHTKQTKALYTIHAELEPTFLWS